MKIYFKDTLVNWSHSKRVNRLLWILAIIGLFIVIVTNSVAIKILVYVGLFAIGISACMMDTVKKKSDEFIKSNKLIYIILSDFDVTFFTMYFFIVAPILRIYGKYIHSFIVSVIVAIAVFVILHKIATKINQYYKNKLIIPKEEE